MGELRVTGWQKGVPFPPVASPCDWQHKMAASSRVQQWDKTCESPAAKPPGDTGRERQRFPGAARWLTDSWFPETRKARLGRLRGNTQAPVNQSRPKGKEVKVTGKKAEAVARGQWSLFCFNQCVPDMEDGSCLAGGGCPCGLIRSVSPLSSRGSLSVAGALMAFMCLTCTHTILVGIVLTCKKDKGETLTLSSRSYFGCSGQWGLCNRAEGNPGQSSSVATTALILGRGSLGERRREEAGKRL